MSQTLYPAIYDIRFLDVSIAARRQYLSRVHGLGFDCLLLSWWQMGLSRSSSAPAFDRLSAERLLQDATSAGLVNLVDVTGLPPFDERSTGAPFDPLDPRGTRSTTEKYHQTPEEQATLIDFFRQLMDMGVAGLRLVGSNIPELIRLASSAFPVNRVSGLLFLVGTPPAPVAPPLEITQLRLPGQQKDTGKPRVLVEDVIWPMGGRRPYEENQRRVAATAAIWKAASGGSGWRLSAQAESRHVTPDDWLWENVRQANAFYKRYDGQTGAWEIDRISAPGAPVTAEVMSSAQGELLRLTNEHFHRRASANLPALLARGGGSRKPAALKSTGAMDRSGNIRLEMGEVAIFGLAPLPPIRPPSSSLEEQRAGTPESPRILIEAVSPQLDPPDICIKRVEGDIVAVECDLIMDGHDTLAANLLWRPADNEDWQVVPMSPIANDRWGAQFQVQRLGQHYFTIEAWRDDFATFQRDITKKKAAGQNVALELQEGIGLLQSALAASAGAVIHRNELRALQEEISQANADIQFSCLTSDEARQLLSLVRPHSFVTRYERDVPVWVDRYSAQFSSWYELFPRSQSAIPGKHGTFLDVIDRLPAIRDMGFDTLYFPPIHPIGKINRKGRNNSLKAEADDPGSPYAIGSAEGGHDALDPNLGTIEDFRLLRDVARDHGLELAMDFAIQCAPDHPWLREHPDWFSWRPDGSIRYAENPPKKYEDIVNVDFYAEGAFPDLWHALRDVVLHWRQEGIRNFRVDNPHTKPFPFWAWLIRDIQAQYPDTIFLAEAFTRPKIMYELAKLGFGQSYTYFTWRNTKSELQDYLSELTMEQPRDFFRPHFFVNTPDINPFFLQRSGRPGFLIRAALACTLSGLWGMYNGFELCESQAIPGKEEYLDSEKYQLRQWDLARPGNIIKEITQLNRLRRENPAFHSHLGVTFHNASNNQILYFSKRALTGDNAVLVAISLDPFTPQRTTIEIPLWLWDLPDDGSLQATDLIQSRDFTWTGKLQELILDPTVLPYAIWRIGPMGGLI